MAMMDEQRIDALREVGQMADELRAAVCLMDMSREPGISAALENLTGALEEAWECGALPNTFGRLTPPIEQQGGR